MASTSTSSSTSDTLPPRPTRSLENRVAIVTGAGSSPANGIGNGRASAILLAEAGCSVVCVDISLPSAERTAELINDASSSSSSSSTSTSTSLHGRAVAFAGDVTSADSCAAAVTFALQQFQRVDILVNNVGVTGARGTAVDVDMSEWASSMQINVSSMVLMSKYAIPAMLSSEPLSSEQMWRGSIVNIGSVAGLQGGTPGNLFYPTSKGAVVNMSRAMAAHHAPQGIRVNCVCPGMLYTPMMYTADGGMTAQVRAARRDRSLLKTEGTGWDCGAAVRFLAGDEARWITGVVLPVDAGATASTAIEW